MPIVVDYTPAGAMMGTAFVVGQQRRADAQSAMDQKFQFAQQEAQQQRSHEIAMQRTNNEMKLLDEQTQMQFAVTMQQQKVQTAMQMELQAWQREQQKLDMAIQSIEESDAWTPEEKSELIARAQAKWAGADIPNTYGGQSTAMRNLGDKVLYQKQKLAEYQNWIKQGVSVSEIQQIARAEGMSESLVKSLDAEGQVNDELDRLTKRMENIQKQLATFDKTGTKRVLNVGGVNKPVSMGGDVAKQYQNLVSNAQKTQAEIDGLLFGRERGREQVAAKSVNEQERAKEMIWTKEFNYLISSDPLWIDIVNKSSYTDALQKYIAKQKEEDEREYQADLANRHEELFHPGGRM